MGHLCSLAQQPRDSLSSRPDVSVTVGQPLS
jgi:hypothetical protein